MGVLYHFSEFSIFNNLFNAELKDGYPFQWKEMKDKESLNNGQLIDVLKKNNISESEIIEKLFEQIKRMKND